MKKMMEHYIDFPTLNDEAKVALILTAACLSPAIMKKIYNGNEDIVEIRIHEVVEGPIISSESYCRWFQN